MKQIQLLFAICVACLSTNMLAQSERSHRGQILFSHTWSVLHETKYIRKNQYVHEIRQVKQDQGKLIIDFMAKTDRKSKNKPHHVVLSLDSILPFYVHQGLEFKFDSVHRSKHHVLSIARRYENCTTRKVAGGIDLMCSKDLLKDGFYSSESAQIISDTVVFLNDSEADVFILDRVQRTHLKGKHLTLMYYFPQAYNIKDVWIDYLVIHLENSPKIKKINYLKLPGAVLIDTLMFPFVLLLSSTIEK